MNNPQKENGYTPIAHEILEVMAKIKLSPTQYRLLFVIWRYTYGFQRKEHDLSLSFLSEATGCDKRQIQRELKKMEERNVINQKIKNGSYRKISFNKNHKFWDESIDGLTNGQTTNGQTTNGETINGSIDDFTNESIDDFTNQDRYIDNSIDINKEKESASRFFEENGFGTLGGYASDMLIDWMNEFPEEVIIMAMKEAVKSNAKNWKYLNRVLNDWKSRNIRTKNDVEAASKQFEDRRNNTIPFKKKKASNDINWEEI